MVMLLSGLVQGYQERFCANLKLNGNGHPRSTKESDAESDATADAKAFPGWRDRLSGIVGNLDTGTVSGLPTLVTHDLVFALVAFCLLFFPVVAHLRMPFTVHADYSV